MRCKNCGWPNKPQVKVCVKCHAPLDANEDVQSGFEPAQTPSSSNEPNLKKTVLESEVFVNHGGASSQSSSDADLNMKTCPKCGYALRPNVSKCPNCNYPIKPEGQKSSYGGSREDEFSDSVRRPTRTANANDGKGKVSGTINPWMMGNMELDPSFELRPIRRMNERKELSDLLFEGKEVVLNRENTDVNNASITSHEQAIVSRIDGHWYIEDRSEQKTTFVQASNKIELHDGDIILLGNRMFEFHG